MKSKNSTGEMEGGIKKETEGMSGEPGTYCENTSDGKIERLIERASGQKNVRRGRGDKRRRERGKEEAKYDGDEKILREGENERRRMCLCV